MKITPAPVISLLHRAIYGTLATQSVKFSGYPYATVIPNIVDAHHQPILLISLLAEHTKNLLADRRISLSITDPGISNIQEGARLTVVGDAIPFEADAAMTARYLRYWLEAAQYLPLDFRFFRVCTPTPALHRRNRRNGLAGSRGVNTVTGLIAGRGGGADRAGPRAR